MRKISRWKINILAGAFALTTLLAGCGEGAYGTVAPLSRNIYQKTEYITADVHKGDMEQTLSLTLKPMNVTKIDYSVDESELELEEISVQAGDMIKKGQVLITFKSDEIKKSIEKYTDEVNRKQMMLDHYTRISGVTYDDEDRQEKYGVILEELADDVALAQTYLAEEQQRLARCQIIAQEDGYVSYINNKVLNGFVEAGAVLITESCGQNRFAGTTRDDFAFNEGDIYKANDESLTYDMRVVEVIEEEEGSRTIVFESVDNSVDPATSELAMVISKPILNDVIYVENDAVCRLEGKTFVYVISEDGFLEAVYVDAGETVGEYIIIKSGLNGTEKVAKK